MQQVKEYLSETVSCEVTVKRLKSGKHIFSHVEWHMTCWVGNTVKEVPGFTWVSREELREAYALPSAFKAYFPLIEELLGT